MRKGQRIGLTWRGNKAHSNDQYRSMRLHDFAPLLCLPRSGDEWIAVQTDLTEAERQEYGLDGYIAQGAAASWEQTWAELASLSLLITVDTSVAHLAGSLGIETWMLLPAVADWRWGIQGDRTPWYPSMRLFRQQTLGDWGAVVAEVREQFLLR